MEFRIVAGDRGEEARCVAEDRARCVVEDRARCVAEDRARGKEAYNEWLCCAK